MIDAVFFETPEEKAHGLQGVEPIPRRTIFIFPETLAGTVFHSRNVLEPFEIYFMNKDGRIMESWRVTPPAGIIQTPMGTETVVEAKDGLFYELGYIGIETAVSEAFRLKSLGDGHG